jgi:hypothetical protein
MVCRCGGGGGGRDGVGEAPGVLVGEPKLNKVRAAAVSVPVTRGGAVVVVEKLWCYVNLV